MNDFNHSLFIYSRIQSQRTHSKVSPRLIIDAGLKSLSLDSGLPIVVPSSSTEQELLYISQGDEHGQIVTKDGKEFDHDKFKLGDFVKLIPGHCDPTFNMVSL